MKTGIIGLPQVGKTSLFKILTKSKLEAGGYSNPKEAHIGIAKVPDARLDKLAALYNPKKLVHTSVEYADVAAIGQEALKETAFAANLRTVDALAHVLRACVGQQFDIAANGRVRLGTVTSVGDERVEFSLNEDQGKFSGSVSITRSDGKVLSFDLTTGFTVSTMNNFIRWNPEGVAGADGPFV